MSMQCRDLLKIPSLKQMKLIGGAAGINRMIRWIYIGETIANIEDTADWIVGNELVFITGSSFNGDIQKITDLVPKLNEKRIAGIVINVGKYITSIPSHIIKMADNLQLPLFELPWEAKLVNVTHDIGCALITNELEENTESHLLENILFGNNPTQIQTTYALTQFGFEYESSCVIGIIEISNLPSSVSEKKPKNMNKIFDNCLLENLYDTFLYQNVKTIMIKKNDSIIFLAENKDSLHCKLEKAVGDFKKKVLSRFPMVSIQVGVGTSCSNVSQFRQCYRQAEQALKIASCERSHTIYYYDSIGVYSLLMSIEDPQILEEYYHDNLDILIEYDKTNNANLLKTLEVYLDNNCKIYAAAKELYIHENTLKYRLNRIETLTGFDIHNIQQLIKLDIGIMISHLFGYK